MDFDGIENISLYNFRSYRFLELPISSEFVVLTGENGAGKTNILEAISLFSSARGIRKAQLNELIHCGCSALSRWQISAKIRHGSNETYFSSSLSNGKRIGYIDETQVSSLRGFEDIMWLLWITPQVSEIFWGQSQIKRKFFDHLVTGISPHHYFRLKHVSKLQKERLHILQHNPHKTWLSTIESKLAALYVSIYEERIKFINLLQDTIQTHYPEILSPNVNCSGDFENSVLNAEYMGDVISERLEASRRLDTEKASTSYGVHKTNWNVLKNNQIDIENSSSGEQKLMLIILILSALRIYRENRTGVPILLLDDIMVHLDQARRQFLCSELQKLNTQVFLTGTDDSFFTPLRKNAQFIKVQNSICVTER